MGSLIDAAFIRARNALIKRRMLSKKMLELLLRYYRQSYQCSLYAVWRFGPTKAFAEHWQNTIQGIVFPAFFYGVQEMFSKQHNHIINISNKKIKIHCVVVKSEETRSMAE